MGLIDLIEKLREKPEMTRRRILVGTTFTITAIIFFFWLSVRLYNVGGPTPADLGVKEVGPIAQAGTVIGDLFDSIGEKVNTVKKMFSTTTPTVNATSSSIDIR